VSAKPPGPQRKRLVVDAPVQLRVIGFVLILVGCALAVVFITMDRGLAEAARQSQQLFVPVAWARRALRAPFFLSGSIVMLAAAVLTLLWSHRVVGPLRVLTEAMRRIREGDLRTEPRLRDTDALREFGADFSRMQASLRERLVGDRERVAEALRRIETAKTRLKQDSPSGKDLDAAREAIESVLASFTL